MKRFFAIVSSLAVALLCISGCDKKMNPVEPASPPDYSVEGTWQLSNLEVKTVSIGSSIVDIYITFSQDEYFSLYQFVGDGRYRHYTGKWQRTADKLSGTYTDNSSWASEYTIRKSDNGKTLILTATNGEKMTFISCTSVPQSVTSTAIEVR